MPLWDNDLEKLKSMTDYEKNKSLNFSITIIKHQSINTTQYIVTAHASRRRFNLKCCLDKDKDCKRQDQPGPGHAPRLGQTQAHQQVNSQQSC